MTSAPLFSTYHTLVMILIFCAGYIAIAFEHFLKINKAAVALLTSVLLWTFHFLNDPVAPDKDLYSFSHYVSEISQLIFFLLGSMTIVELIDAHRGFKLITDFIHTRSKRKMLWVTSFLCFFLSAALDNLTTTIVMVSLLRKLIPDREDRWVFGALIVISANAGGCWTPIGDLTTTMLWIEGVITTRKIMEALLIPGMVSLLFSLLYQSFFLKGNFPPRQECKTSKTPLDTDSKIIFWVGLLSLISVPIFKEFTGLPPFVATFSGLSILWLITDILHHQHEDRYHLRIPHILAKVDISGVLFFLGILLAVSSLATVGILKSLALYLDQTIGNYEVIAILIGIFSSIIDNVPLVAACLNMYSIEQFPVNSPFWELIAYCAGTGGSILVIGSAAGIAYMGIEKVDFFWYLRKITPTALVGYLAGALTYIYFAKYISFFAY